MSSNVFEIRRATAVWSDNLIDFKSFAYVSSFIAITTSTAAG